MTLYEYVGFDRKSNRELVKRVPAIVLRFRWLRDRLAGDRAACIGYQAWLYVQVTDGMLITAEMLDWNQHVI